MGARLDVKYRLVLFVCFDFLRIQLLSCSPQVVYHNVYARIQTREAKSKPPASHQPTEAPREKEK